MFPCSRHNGTLLQYNHIVKEQTQPNFGNFSPFSNESPYCYICFSSSSLAIAFSRFVAKLVCTALTLICKTIKLHLFKDKRHSSVSDKPAACPKTVETSIFVRIYYSAHGAYPDIVRVKRSAQPTQGRSSNRWSTCTGRRLRCLFRPAPLPYPTCCNTCLLYGNHETKCVSAEWMI